ncbi:MAG: SDR family NAD(P)-dependent oxidoreductase [Betaproteobacteria bacterium]|nr:SDR family NAD(P)-dependent oxidoreductase [Betaproteobacteria bacterium]
MTLLPHAMPAGWVPPPGHLTDRTLLITGAGQGIGRATARACASAGAVVILLGRSASKLEAVYDEIVGQGGPKPAIVPFDLSSATQDQLQALALSIKRTTGRLDGIVHAASHFTSTMPLEAITLEAWERTARIHLTGPAALTQTCYPMLKRAPDASIVFLTESHAEDPRAYWGGFATVKSALRHLVAVWADENETTGPRFNLLLPGPLRAPMRHRSHPGEDAGRLADVDVVARPMLYLLGPAPLGSRINGVCVSLDPAQ